MKSRTPSFVIELGLNIGEDQESALETYFSDACQLFNAVLGTAKKRVRAMKSTEAWKLTAAMPKGKDRNKRFKENQKSARLTEYALHDVVKEHRAKGGFTKRIGINPHVSGRALSAGCFIREVSRGLRVPNGACTALRENQTKQGCVGRLRRGRSRFWIW